MNDHSPSLDFSEAGRPYVAPSSLDELEENRQKANALEVDLKAIWSAVFRNRYIILSIVLVFVMLGLIVALLTTPIYRARASVQIEQTSAKVLNEGEVDPEASASDADRFLQTQLDILQSRALALRVAEDLGLFRNDRFLLQMGKSSSGSSGPDAVRANRERVIGVLQKAMSVELPRSSRVATISFDSPDPDLAARVANAYVSVYINSNLKRKFDTSAYTRSFLSTQLTETKAKLEQSERMMIQYAREAELIDTSVSGARDQQSGGGQQAGASLTSSNLVQLNSAYSTARAARIQAQQRWEQAQRTPVSDLAEVINDPGISRLQTMLAEASAQYRQDRQRFGDEHPTIAQQKGKLRELESQIGRQSAAIKASIKDQYLLAMRQEEALAQNVRQLTGATLAEQDRGVRMNILRREVDTNRALYDGLLQRYKEVSAAAGITTNNISVIDVAERPLSPISPNAVMNMFLGGLGGLAIALALTFVRAKFDDVIRSPEDVDRKLGLPFLNAIPIPEGGMSVDEALNNPRSNVSEAYFALRTSLQLSSPAGLPKVMLFSSSSPAEGKTTSAIASARAFAQVGKRVLLVDGDLRKPSVHKRFEIRNLSGLSNVLARDGVLPEVIQDTQYNNLRVLTSGPLPPNPAELVSGVAMHETIQAASALFDLVIIDGPPVLGLADAPALGSMCDATVFVIEANRSARGQTKAAVRRLFSARAKVIGAVLTKFDAKKIGYSSDYSYAYYYYGTDSSN